MTSVFDDHLKARLLSDGGHGGYMFAADPASLNPASAKVLVARKGDDQVVHTAGGTDVADALARAHAWVARR